MPRILFLALALAAAAVRAAEPEPAPTPAPPKKPEPAVVTAAPGKGVTIATTDEKYSLTLKPRFQLRETVAKTDGSDAAGELQVRTVRLSFGGHILTPKLKYQLQLALGGNDFEKTSSSPIYDAALEWAISRDATLKAGQYLVPFDRARTVGESTLQLGDRAQPVSELNLDRDIGISLGSKDLLGLDGKLNYVVGLFSGDGRNRFDRVTPSYGFLWVARLGFKPFGAFDDDSEGDLERSPKLRVAAAIAAAYDRGTNRPKATTGDALTLGNYDTTHLDADLVVKVAGFSFVAEALSRQASRPTFEGNDSKGAPLKEWTRSAWGWLAQAGYMVTDQVEIASRFAQLRAPEGPTDPALLKTISKQGREVTLGANLYLNGHALKLQGDFTRFYGVDFAKGQYLGRLVLDASF